MGDTLVVCPPPGDEHGQHMSPPPLRVIRGSRPANAPTWNRGPERWSKGAGNLVYLTAPPAEDARRRNDPFEGFDGSGKDMAAFLQGGVLDDLVSRKLGLLEKFRRNQD